jgi:hypothetical protein
MMHTAISIVAVWRPAVRTTDDAQATVTLEPVNQQARTVTVGLHLQLSFDLPPQDQQLPHTIEAHVHRAGLEAQRALFAALIEHADRQLVLSRRGGKGGAGIQLRGTRPFTFKTIFGTVTVDRLRITHRGDGTSEVPSATAWGTAHRCEITRGLREAICDQMLDESTGAVRQDVGAAAGEPELVCRATVLNVVHGEGVALLEAARARADDALRKAPEAWPPAPAQPLEGPPVVVELDEVKVKAQPQTGRKEIWLFTAVVRLLAWSYLLVDSTQEGLTRQLAALLHRLGVCAGRRPLLVLADGAGWIRAWFEGLAVPGKAMVLCWYHLRKRCYQKVSGSGLPKAQKKPLLGRVLGALWEGKVDVAVRALRDARDAATRPGWIDELIGYLEARRPYLPDYKSRKEAGEPLASHRVEKWNDWAVSERCKGRGMSWTAEGVVALAVLEAARRNGELDAWRRGRKLPPLKLPRPPREAA